MSELKQPSREWQRKAEAIRGTMGNIADRINVINSSDRTFVIATHQPTLMSVGFYETIIFYMEKRS